MTIRQGVLIALTLFLGWIAIMALVMRFSNAAPAAVVMFPGERLLNNLPDAALLGQNSVSITLKSDADDFVEKLYAGGAWLVLPAGLVGCLPLPKGERQ